MGGMITDRGGSSETVGAEVAPNELLMSFRCVCVGGGERGCSGAWVRVSVSRVGRVSVSVKVRVRIK